MFRQRLTNASRKRTKYFAISVGSVHLSVEAAIVSYFSHFFLCL